MTNSASPKEFAKGAGEPANVIRKILKGFDRWSKGDDLWCVERYIESEAGIVVHFFVEGFAEEFVAHLQGKLFIGGPDKDRGDFRGPVPHHFRESPIHSGRNVEGGVKCSAPDEEFVLTGVIEVMLAVVLNHFR